ncbi:MAG: ACP S-malonyltransferase [Lachnospiraceae bacterium]|nr:ACP S-malonyltransferase [Lachnospiraceae bacterium]
MSIAFLYAGQGSQCAGMGKDLYESEELFKNVIDRADPGFDLKQIMFEADLETLSETRYTQPALAAFAAGVTAILYENNIRPSYVAGLSLGEYSALHAAGVFDTDTLIRLTAFRGRKMQEAAERTDGVMSAILGLPAEKVEEICKKASSAGTVEVANYNTAVQTVIGGDRKAVEAAEALAKEAGAKRCMRLKVSSAFHTSYMDPASEALEMYFRKLVFHPMQIPVIFNTLAQPLADTQEEQIKSILVKQVKSGVRMKQTIEYLAAQGIDTIVEIGPGKALSGFVKKTAPEIKTYAIGDVESLQTVLDEWKK